MISTTTPGKICWRFGLTLKTFFLVKMIRQLYKANRKE